MARHDGPRSHDRFETDAHVLYDRCADPDEHARLDRDVSRQANAGTDVSAGSDHGFVIDDASSVEDGVVADLAVRADQSARRDDNALAE